MANRDIEMAGTRELVGYLEALPRNLAKNTIGAGLRAAAAPIRDTARDLAKKRSGKMAKAIKTGSVRDNRDGTYSITVRLKGPHAFLGWFVENGVAPHFLQGGDSGLSARKLTQALNRASARVEADGQGREVLKIGDRLVSGAVFHPGLPPSPFMRPALDMRGDDAVKAFAVTVRDYIEGKTGFAPPSLGEAA